MSSLSRWRLKGVLGYVAKNLAIMHRTAPEERMRPLLHGTGWSYGEWAFFHAAKRTSGVKLSETEIGRLAKSAQGDFRDFLLAIALKIDAETRKAIFLSPENFHKTLRDIAEVVLEHMPAEFRADDWIGSRFTTGANAFLQLHMLQ